MNREQKSQLVKDLKENLGSSSFIALIHYSGINDKNLYDIRVSLKSQSCSMKIVKNNLTKIAVKDTDIEIITPYLVGPVAFLYSQDPVALAKVILESSKKNESLKIITGCLENTIVSEDKIKSLAKLGSLQDVRGAFVRTISSVQSNFVRNLNYNKTSLVSLIKNYSSQKDES